MKNSYPFIAFLFLAFNANGQFVLFDRMIDFENNAQYAVIDTTMPGNLWQKGIPDKSFLNVAYTPPYAIITDTVQNYPPGNTSAFMARMYAPGQCWGVGFLNFWHKYDMESLKAGGYLEVAYDSSMAFVNIIYDTASSVMGSQPPSFQNFYTSADTLNDGTPCFTGHSNGWVGSSVMWVWFLGVKEPPMFDSLTIRFVFKSLPDALPGQGWMIDNIHLQVDECTGAVDELSMKQPFILVTPNPFHSDAIFRMVNFEPGIYNMDVYNSQGKMVMERQACRTPGFSFSRGHLPQGIYFYRVFKGAEEKASGKFILD